MAVRRDVDRALAPRAAARRVRDAEHGREPAEGDGPEGEPEERAGGQPGARCAPHEGAVHRATRDTDRQVNHRVHELMGAGAGRSDAAPLLNPLPGRLGRGDVDPSGAAGGHPEDRHAAGTGRPADEPLGDRRRPSHAAGSRGDRPGTRSCL